MALEIGELESAWKLSKQNDRLFLPFLCIVSTPQSVYAVAL